ncbi:MAG: RidA family protein [Gammaproteobacteria bacterium]|nr:RidA family protein [Gammaproteobacteria bacterium]
MKNNTKKHIKTALAPAAIGPYSQAISCNGLLFVSGQIPLDPQTGQIVSNNVQEQTQQVLENAKTIIEASGLTLENVVKCTCFLKNMNDFPLFNEIYSQYFGTILPARECVEVARLPKDVLVEVSMICSE